MLPLFANPSVSLFSLCSAHTDTAFKQQRLTAWQPVLTPIKVIIIFLAIGIAFVPTGVTLLNDANDVSEEKVRGTSVFTY